MTYCVSCQLSILSEQIERKVLHLPLESEKPSQIHGTCTHSPLLSSAFEGMTATSQRVKILKPILGSPTDSLFFFFPFPSEQRKSGILQTSQHSLYFPCARAVFVVILRGLSMTPEHFVVIFNIKYPFRDYLMLHTVYSLLRLHASL